MFLLILLLVIAGFVAAACAMWSDRKGDTAPIVEKATCSTCNGENSKCEQECMMEAATRPVEYYDDEELDNFRGTPSDGYSDDAAEQFADVLYTMRADEVAGWCRSLHLRGIELPDQLKDEVTMLIDESHETPATDKA